MAAKRPFRPGYNHCIWTRGKGRRLGAWRSWSLGDRRHDSQPRSVPADLESIIAAPRSIGRARQGERSSRFRDPLDARLGARVMARRRAVGLSSRELGEVVGVSHQQIRRYETGSDRMAAAMLVRICAALQTSITAVCEGLDVGVSSPRPIPAYRPPALGSVERLIEDFSAIRQPAVRAHLCKLVSSLAASAGHDN